jgi:hypothetical protein
VAVLCSSTASKGPFYRHGRERELGFPEGVWREKFRGAAALAMMLGHGDGSWVTRLLRWRAGIARDLGSGRRACSLVGRLGGNGGDFSTVHWPGSGLTQ